MRIDILSRKYQVNLKKDNKNIKMLKNKLWKMRISTKAKIAMFKRNLIVEETVILEEI